ncbi:MAG: SGNH/GDSL hydrolase family protein [Gammaproteobacteria bacterium]|nr:SGNH/GDSL hydrolase family protein [Gammaproteobacteria bacterium]
MRQYYLALAVVVSTALAGCGGGSSDLPAKPNFTALVSFGDSLSDVGSYKTSPAVLAYNGGQFTINAASGVATNWTQMMADSLSLPEPCAAVTGGIGAARSPATGATPGCYAFAQGGARVTSASGVGNVGTLAGPMTEPVVTQVSNYLSVNTSFNSEQLVLVMAGANDVFTQAGAVGLGLPAASAVQAVQTAATELAAQVNTQIIGNGASHVVVMNVPDIASTPYGTSLGASGQGLLNTLVTAFNTQLRASLPDSANVLYVDAFAANHDEVVNPDKYALSNVTIPTCLASLPNSGSSLFCTSATLNTGVDTHYLFADGVHPTPYGHALFSLYVLQAMTNKGWY